MMDSSEVVKIKDVIYETPTIKTIIFDWDMDRYGVPNPGEFVMVWNFENEKPMSISEIDVSNNQLAITVKDVGEFTHQIHGLKVGDEITIFDAIQLTTTKYIEYSVKKGDSLYSIARSYNTTVDEIKRLNSLVKEELFIGQKLRLPEYDQIDDTKLEDYIDYTVKKGDSLYSIAKTYHTTVDQILKDNNMGDTA